MREDKRKDLIRNRLHGKWGSFSFRVIYSAFAVFRHLCWVTIAHFLMWVCVTLTPAPYYAVAFLSGFVEPLFRFQGLGWHMLC